MPIIISDVHLENWPNHNVRPFHRLEASFEILEEVFKKAEKLDTFILLTGDLFHTPLAIKNEVLYFSVLNFKRLFEKYKSINIYGIPGNHDECERVTMDSNGPNYIKTFALIFEGRFIDIDRQKVEVDGINLFGIGYLYNNAGFIDIVEGFQCDDDKVNILAIHTELPGITDTNGYETEAIGIPDKSGLKELFQKFDFVFSGHIHQHKFVTKKIISVGAPNEQRTSDMGSEFGYLILNEELEITRHKTKYPKFVYGERTNDFDMFLKEPTIETDMLPSDEEGDIFVPDGTKDKNLLMVKTYLGIKKIKGLKRKIALNLTKEI